MSDAVIIGGGVIGLSLACELAARNMRVQVLEAGSPGQESSWAGAGILPPAARNPDDPYEQLLELSNRLHRQWAESLRAETGIDNGYRRCGALYLANGQQCTLAELAAAFRARGIAVEELDDNDTRTIEPGLDAQCGPAIHLPEECQLRNPWHLKALVAAATQRGVTIVPDTPVEDFETSGGRVMAVRAPGSRIAADMVCIATGAWTGAAVSKLMDPLPIKPIRGQIALVNAGPGVLRRIVNAGRRYLVPREDGRILIGSTEEDVGFDRRTTLGVISDLLNFAGTLVPQLRQAQFERSWAGLRPWTVDGLPYLGVLPGYDNAFIAAGHYRAGLQLAPGTAVVMAQLMSGESPSVDLRPFRVDRH